MENDESQTAITEKVLSLQIVRRIEYLYGVTPKLADNECAVLTETCSFDCRTDCTQESMDKAKKYLQAYLEEGPGYSVTSENYNLDLVNMILLHRDDLEKQSATVITASPNSTNVRIQGQLQDLIMTKKLIQDYMKKGNISKSIQNIKPTVSETPPVPFVHEYFKTSRAQKTFEDDDEDDDETDSENEGTSPRGMLNTENSSSLQHCMYPHLDAPPQGTLGMSHDTSHDVSHVLSGEVTDTSDEEELFLDLQADPAYRNKVEFTLKLGYQEADLLRALRKVGIHAQENELLSELIQQDSSRPDNELDSDMSGMAVDYDDSADFVYSRKQVVLGDPTSNLRHIIIDGSNVAMSHGNKEVFSCRGIQLAVDWFRQRGHSEITVFVPQWRKETPRAGTRIKDQTILTNLEKDKILVFTPARRIGGKRVVCYDDRYVLKLAVETDGVVVSNDNYRDLISEKEEFKKIIEERLLMYSFVNDRFMPPDDPLGRGGPTLENFLLKRPSQPEPLPPPCPYGSKKCTYGNKCKYYHPERRNQPHKTVTEKLAEQAKLRMLEMKERNSQAECKKKLSQKMSLQRTKSFTPGETCHMAGSHDLSSALSGSVSTLERSEDDRYLQYQQKTAEDLRKLEFEKSLRQQQDISQKKTLEKASTRCKVNVGDLRASNNSPVMQGAPIDNNHNHRVTIDNLRNQGSTNDNMPSQGVTIENLRSQGSVIDNLRSQGSSRGSSPVSNLIVPGHGSNLDSGEQFISGHLLLAKKLSDEANSESDKLKNIARTEADRQNSSYCFGNTRGKSEEPARQKLKQPVKQALSRQLSLQGSEDPRLHQGHRSLQAQYSYDPRRVSFGNQFSHAGSEQSLHALGALSSDMYRNTQDSNFGHTSLSRMQSAPNPFVLQHNKQNKVPLVKRQNSSSDTQLDKLETECYGGTLPDGLFLAGLHSSPLSHVNKPMKDTTGAVTFQIGGSVQQRQQVPHYRSTGALSHVHQQAYNPSDRDAQYLPQYVQPHQASHQPHHPQALGAMYRDAHTYMNPVSQGMMQSFPTAQPAYLHSQSVLMESGPGYYDQSAVWESNLPNQTNISLPVHFHQTPMQRGMNRGSVSPHRASPNSQDHTHAIPYMFQQQQQQQQQQLWTGSSSQTSQPTSHTKPIPMNMAIPESDPRQKVFYHLCALFPEEKVLSVMNQHPECMDPKEICAYIITSS